MQKGDYRYIVRRTIRMSAPEVRELFFAQKNPKSPPAAVARLFSDMQFDFAAAAAGETIHKVTGLPVGSITADVEFSLDAKEAEAFAYSVDDGKAPELRRRLFDLANELGFEQARANKLVGPITGNVW